MASGILFTNATQQSTGLKNLLYDAHIQAGQRSMLIALVNGSHKERDQLFACAEEEGFFDGLPAHLQPPAPGTNASSGSGEQSYHSSHFNHPAWFDIQVVLYEALLGSRRVRGTSDLVAYTKTRKQTLQKTLAARRKRGATHSYQPKIRMPRYVRVNELLTSTQEVITYLKEFGYACVGADTSSDNTFKALQPMTFCLDPYIPTLLVFPPSTSFHGDPQVDAGALVLQDRSSCLTALALSPPPDAHVLDTCSAPGNKTLHLASIMAAASSNGTKRHNVMGRIAAFERSENRYHTLQRRIELQGATDFVTPHWRDFMTVDTAVEFPEVSHILIDPSCSGSGLVAGYAMGASPELGHSHNKNTNDSEDNTLEHDSNGSSTNNNMNSDEVANLAAEQEALILHAMSLPKARVIAYSTCSVHRTENEDVVLAVLAKANEQEQRSTDDSESKSHWKLVKAVPQWPHRGLDLPEFAEIADLVCRADFEQDGTNGFFVARFEKVIATQASKKKKKMAVDEHIPKKEKKRKKKKEKEKAAKEADDLSEASALNGASRKEKKKNKDKHKNDKAAKTKEDTSLEAILSEHSAVDKEENLEVSKKEKKRIKKEKKERKKRKKSAPEDTDNDKDDTSVKKKSKKAKRDKEARNNDGDNEDRAETVTPAKKKSKRHEGETAEERKERKASKKKKRRQ